MKYKWNSITPKPIKIVTKNGQNAEKIGVKAGFDNIWICNWIWFGLNARLNAEWKDTVSSRLRVWLCL